MTDSKRLVYSTVHGSLGKPMRGKGKKKPRQPGTAIINPSKHGVRIRREVKGRSGKAVSVIDGLPLSDEELRTLLKQLKGQLGTGGTIRNGSLEIQGDQRDKLLQLLKKEGYKAKLAGG